VRLERTSVRTNALLFFAVLAAPFAWAVQLVVGSELEEAGCRARPGLDSDPWTLALTAGGVALAVAAALVAAAAVREVRRGGGDERGRIAFMAWSGLLVNLVFGALILLGGIGAASLGSCVQS
jgi:hypothetical protein